MPLQIATEFSNEKRSLKVENLKNNTLLFLGHSTRSEYYESLLKRLEFIPQLFLNSNARNRLTHVTNGLVILDLMENKGLFTNKQFCQDSINLIKKSYLLHDIGHPQFGHAGERALNEFLKEFNLNFHNSTFSSSLQLDLIENDTHLINILGNNIFNLNIIKSNVDSKILIDKVVDFIDDIENSIGDLLDLIMVLEHPIAISIFEKHFNKNDNIVSEIALKLINKHINNSTEFIKFLLNENHELKIIIKELRNEISKIIKNEKTLIESDLIWFEETKIDIKNTFNTLLEYSNYSEKEIADLTVKIVALKSIKSHEYYINN